MATTLLLATQDRRCLLAVLFPLRLIFIELLTILFTLVVVVVAVVVVESPRLVSEKHSVPIESASAEGRAAARICRRRGEGHGW